MDSTSNSLNWFEIPVTDIDRATKFYETVFDLQLERMEMMGMKMAMFPSTRGSGKANGALAQSEMHKPSMEGCIVYLNTNPDLNAALGLVEKAGGRVLMPKTGIGGNGFMAFFADPEGNRIGLHSNG